MNREDYRIDPNTIDERMMSSKTRQDWNKKRQELRSEISKKIQMQSTEIVKDIANIQGRVDVPIVTVEIAKEIQIIQEQIDYIDEVLERWYMDMCIRCGKLTEVETYCGIPNNCKHCLAEWISRALSKLDDEDVVEVIDKQLTDIKKRGMRPNGDKGTD